MKLENKELIQLLEKQAELQEVLDKAKSEQAEAIKALVPVQKEYAKITNEISKIIVPEVFDKIEDYEMPEAPYLKDGEAYIDIKDMREEAIADVKQKIKEARDGWKEYLAKLEEDEKKIEDVKETLGA